MTGWAVIWVLGVCAVAAAFANHRYHWAAGWWYSWQHAAHVIGQTEREPEPAPEYGSMILDEEMRAIFLPAPPELAHEPDWREQTAADLAPETLAHAPWDGPWPSDDRELLDDSGPGDLSSLHPGPDPFPECESVPALLAELDAGSGPGLTRLADTGDIMNAHLLADVQAFMRRQDAEAVEYLAAQYLDLQEAVLA